MSICGGIQARRTRRVDHRRIEPYAQSIAVYAVDPDSLRVVDVRPRPYRAGLSDPYGILPSYHDPAPQFVFYAFRDTDGDGRAFRLWLLLMPTATRWRAIEKVRDFAVGIPARRVCVADDATGALYIAEEDVRAPGRLLRGSERRRRAPSGPTGSWTGRLTADDRGRWGSTRGPTGPPTSCCRVQGTDNVRGPTAAKGDKRLPSASSGWSLTTRSASTACPRPMGWRCPSAAAGARKFPERSARRPGPAANITPAERQELQVRGRGLRSHAALGHLGRASARRVMWRMAPVRGA
jgi:hypothetical protein